MKKLALLGVLLLCLVLVSCPSSTYLLIDMDFSINKNEVAVGEKIELVGLIHKSYMNGETDFVLYIENYPKEYQIIEGNLFEPFTSEKYLCIVPAHFYNDKGIVKVQMSFSEIGEYILRINGSGQNAQKLNGLWNDEKYVYTILVK